MTDPYRGTELRANVLVVSDSGWFYGAVEATPGGVIVRGAVAAESVPKKKIIRAIHTLVTHGVPWSLELGTVFVPHSNIAVMLYGLRRASSTGKAEQTVESDKPRTLRRTTKKKG